MNQRLLKIIRWPLLVFAIYPGDRVTFGKEQGFSHLTALMSLSGVTAASYALTVNQIQGAEALASWFYFLMMSTILFLVSFVINSKRSSRVVGIPLQMDASTIWYGRAVNFLTLVLMISFWIFAFEGWFPGQRPQGKDYTGTEIKFAKAVLAGAPPVQIGIAGIFQDQSTEDSQLVERFKAWFCYPIADVPRQQIVVIEQYPAFDGAYNPFSVVILHRPTGIIFKDALVFVKRRLPAAGGGAIKYAMLRWRWGDVNEAMGAELEQIRMPRNQSGTPYPVFMVPKSDIGDSLLIFLRFEVAKDAKFVLDPEWFQIQLRRVQR